MDLKMEDVEKRSAIIVAPNGARKMKADHSAIPITTQEIVTDVIACRDEGAAMVHLHARNAAGLHSLAIDDNLLTLEAVKSAVGDSIIIQLTTEAIGQYRPAQQMELIRETTPEAASFGLNELIPDDSYLPEAEKFFNWVSDSGIIAQYILYSADDLKRYFELIKLGILPNKNHHILLVLGRYHKALLSSPKDLIPFFNEPGLKRLIETREKCWATCAFGYEEQKCLMSSMLMGSDVRVGFENNLYNNQGQQAINNAQQVLEIKNLSNLLNIKLHDAYSFRQALTI